jgi:hypothetical protein
MLYKLLFVLTGVFPDEWFVIIVWKKNKCHVIRVLIQHGRNSESYMNDWLHGKGFTNPSSTHMYACRGLE